MRARQYRTSWQASFATIALASIPVVQAKEAPPETTPEGLVLLKSTKSRVSYVKPGATFAQYNRVAILEPWSTSRRTGRRTTTAAAREPTAACPTQTSSA